MKVLLTLSLLTFTINTVIAQSCGCSTMLESLITKTESNYAGFIHKVKEQDSTSYVKLKAQVRKEAIPISFDNCFSILDRYVSFFKDGHLFVFESPASPTPKQSDSIALQLLRYATPTQFEKAINPQKNVDAIVGTWQNTDYKMAVIKKDATHFEAVVLNSKIEKWKPGMVKMEIEKNEEGNYNIALYRNDFAKIHFNNVHIYKNVVLPFGNYRFIKTSPENAELNYVNANNPQLPILKPIDKDNVLLTIPSALINGAYLDSLLQRYEKEINTAQNLIIDIRGNLGGNFIWGKLYDIANTVIVPPKIDPKEDYFFMLASEDNATYFANFSTYYKQQKDTAGIQYYDSLATTIKRNIGSILKFSYYNPFPDTATRVVQAFPKKIAIIMDKGVGSAAEAFVLWMKENSSRVVFYGDNTYGMIDYQNINMVPFGCKENTTYYFGYPTLFSKDIKTNPLNPTGIKPDIYIPQKTADAIKWVLKDLAKKNNLALNNKKD